MSHSPTHVFGPATSEMVVNPAGERQAVLVRYCTAPGCGEREVLSGGVFEPPPEFRHLDTLQRPHFAKTQQVNEEPDS